MNANCIICSDLFSATDDVFTTRCGHLFHHSCLLNWFERSKSCPQCRNKTNTNSIFRIYFNHANTEGITLDVGSLQAKVDDVEFQLKQKDKELMQSLDEIRNLNKKFTKSQEVIKNNKETLMSKETALTMLNEQLEFLKHTSEESSKLRADNEKLTKYIATLKGVEDIVHGTASEVDMMMKETTEIEKLCTYITVLKRAVIEIESKRKVLREAVNSAKNKLAAANTKKNEQASRIVLLEETLEHAEGEVEYLKKELKEKATPVDNPALVKLKRKSVASSCDSNPQKYMKASSSPIKEDDAITPIPQLSDPQETNEIVESVKSIEESTSPYLSLKQSSIVLAPFQLKKAKYSSPKANEYSIFKPHKLSDRMKSKNNGDLFKAMLAKRKEQGTSYDGLGGHFKPDVFPTPLTPSEKKDKLLSTKKTSMKDKMKRLQRPTSQNTIDNFLT